MNPAENFQANAKSPQRILVRGVNWLGDAVMATPALRRLREKFFSARVTLLMPEKLADLFAGHPDVDEIATFAAGESPWKIGRRLRPGNFDLAVVLPNSPRSAMEAWFSGARRRIGYARSWRSFFLTDAVPPRSDERPMRKRSAEEVRKLVAASLTSADALPAKVHHIHQYLHLVAALGASGEPLAPHLHLTDRERRAALERLGDSTRAWVGINAGAEYGPAKRWPKERFIAVAKRLATERGLGLVLFGGKADIAVANEIEQAVRGSRTTAVVNVAGKTTLRELCALMAECRVVLTNDTGPMHVAAAVGATVVVPFGSTSPEMTGPGLPGDGRHVFLSTRVACAPCFLRECPIDFRCMTGIGETEALEAVLARIGGR